MPLAQPSKRENLHQIGGEHQGIPQQQDAVALATVILGVAYRGVHAVASSVALEKGQFAKRDIQAQRTIVNRVATEKLREEARKAYLKNAPSFPDNYEINQSYSYIAEETVESIFDAISLASGEMPEEDVEAIGQKAAGIIADDMGIAASEADLASWLQ